VGSGFDFQKQDNKLLLPQASLRKKQICISFHRAKQLGYRFLLSLAKETAQIHIEEKGVNSHEQGVFLQKEKKLGPAHAHPAQRESLPHLNAN
jgi:hypothetical protein